MSANLFYIVDAGSTKTDLAIVKGNSVTIESFQGFNPNHSDLSTLNEIKKIVEKNTEIYFYGSGLSSLKNQNIVINELSFNNVKVYSDVLGAARALLGQKKGIVSIMGTGGVVAYHDGETIIETKGGYGYLIDDLGGGLELSKVVVSKWLNNELSIITSNKIQQYFDLSTQYFISSFYQSKDKQKLAKLCQILPQLLQTDSQLENSVLEYFESFIKKHIILLCQQYDLNEINCVGSIAFNFKFIFEKALSKYNLKLNNVLSKPISNLVEFHKNQK